MAEVKAKDTPAPVTKPERPDEAAFKAELAKAEKEHKAAEDRMKQIKAKIDLGRPNNKDSPSSKRQQELRAELSAIRSQQQSSKTSRTGIMDKIKRLDENLKSRINEQKTARGKVQYKSVDDVQRQIEKLQAEVDTGKMRLVDEKKALADISQLNRIKKGFAGFEDSQKGIDEVKAQIAELRKTMDDPESKALSDRYQQITTELDKIKAEQDEVYKNINALRDERTKLHEDQQTKYLAIKEIKDRFYQSRRAAAEYEREAKRIRDEKRRAENDAFHRGRRQEVAQSKLEEASAPAFQDEIRTAQNLILHFDPSSAVKQEAAGPGKFAATASRTVDGTGIKGTALAKKGAEEENYFIGGGGKKKKGGKAATKPAGTPTEGKFNLDLGTIDSLAKVGVDPPMSQADVPSVVEKLKEKVAFWKGDQDRQTKENVRKAQAEIDKLEAEATAAETKAAPADTSKPASEKVNGQSATTANADSAADANTTADELKKAKLEDATSADTTA